jgi:hypothetical protein
MIAILLLPIMVKTAKEFGTQPRITFTSSEMHNTTAGDVKPEAQAAPAILEKMSDKKFCTPKSVAGHTQPCIFHLFTALNAKWRPGRNPVDTGSGDGV